MTYGMIPSAKIANWESAPPEKRFSRLRTVPLWPRESSSIAEAFTPGAGIHEPRR